MVVKFHCVRNNSNKNLAILTALFDEHAQRGGIVLLTSHQEVPSSHLQKLNLAAYKAE